MAKCPHCGKELEFTVIPRKPKAAPKTAKAASSAAKPAVKKVSGPKKDPAPKAVPKRPLLKKPDFLKPGS